MEKNIAKRKVELARTFDEVWKSLCGESVELETEVGTPFVVKAKMARRRGSATTEEVLVFLRDAGNEKLKECSRCYSEDWGYYFNHLGKEGQRIGMFCRAIDFLGQTKISFSHCLSQLMMFSSLKGETLLFPV